MVDPFYEPQVDYTSRDYASIREDLIALIPNFAPQWTSRDSSDFGIVLIELFSYLGDLLNFQIDRAANEGFIDTATQRDTVLKLAKLLGYTPTSITPAQGSVVVKNSTTSPITVNAGNLVFGASNGSEYTADSNITSLAAGATTSVNVTQGVLATDDVLGTSDGTAGQSFALKNTGVVNDSSLVILVGTEAYTKSSYLLNNSATDKVYSVYTDGSGVTHIEFGDGISGNIPPKGKTITASTYRHMKTSGSSGNIPANSISSVNVSGLSIVSSSVFSGGADAESTDSVRVNAPKSLKTLDRAISLSDYSTLAIKNNPGIAKASALSLGSASVVVYVANNGGKPLSSADALSIKNSFVGKTPPEASVTIYDYSPVYPYLNVSLQIAPQYNQTAVLNAVRVSLASLLSFDNVSFADTITEVDIYTACKSVDGVMYVTINDMQKLGTNPNDASGLYSETFTLKPQSTVTLTAAAPAGSTTLYVSSIDNLIPGQRVAGGSDAILYGTTIVSKGTNSSGNFITLSAATSNSVSISNGATIYVLNNTSIFGSNTLAVGSNVATGVNVVQVQFTTTQQEQKQYVATGSYVVSSKAGAIPIDTTVVSTSQASTNVWNVTLSNHLTSNLTAGTDSLSFTVPSTTYAVSSGNCGVYDGSKITSVVVGSESCNSGVGATISSVTSYGSTSPNMVTFSSNTLLPPGATVTVTGSAGATPGNRDIVCGISEVPIYVDSYVTLTGDGGS